MSKLEELKQEADDLGVTYSGNIGEAKLQEKINAHYESKEDSVVVPKEDEPVKETPVAVKGKLTKLARAKEAERAARATRVITIIDNDQRVNNQTTTCTVSCGNEYFDLGTMLLPLNMPVEVMQGHINVLKEVEIPQHVKDNRTSLSTVVLRKRYTISYEDKQ